MNIAEEPIDAGAASAFLVADDDIAVAIESALRSSGYQDTRCVRMPPGGVLELRGTQHLA